ncbi:MAG TPA: protein kinase [Terriglobia bacterium]|nr:protein kinase [Terriglobia bacterium]
MTEPVSDESGQKTMQDADGREQLVANAVADYLDRLTQGETLDIDGFCRRHPALEPDLRVALEAAQGIDAMLRPEDPSLPARRPEAELPERLSGHKILSEIGSGGMGRVLLAIDERLGRKVAIKVLSPAFQGNALLRERFMQEARAMARLTHPHIAHIYSLGPAGEAPHFVMEYVEGAPLTEADRPLTLRQKVELMHKIVLAVDFLHQHQVIHRDLKPGNILVGPDLEPKVLDFGLVVMGKEQGNRLTQPGDLLGTPDYFSPEQARAAVPLDPRSDIFSLGTVFYELLTSELPFHGETLPEQVRRICEEDPALPRRIDSTISGDLQNVCLKALEKSPAHRYASAREMAGDLERFLAGEPVLAVPTSYSRLMTGRIDQHLRELASWKQDHILSEVEFDSFRKLYERLVDREDAWIMAVRRLTFSQVSLYLGAWILVLGAVLVMLFHYPRLTETPSVLVVSVAAVSTAWIGVRCWQQNQRRIAVAYLLAFCLVLPVAWLVVMGRFGVLTAPSRGDPALEFLAQFATFKRTSNAQLWWAILLSLPAYFWLRRFTRASVFSLVFAVMCAALTGVSLLRMGLLQWLDTDPGRPYLDLIPFALAFFLAGMLIERLHYPADSRYFYTVAVVATLVSLSGVALYHEPYAQWLKRVLPRTRGQLEYLFIVNAAIYLLLQSVCERLPLKQMRAVAKTFSFVIPGHVLTSLFLLGLAASDLWSKSPASAALRHESRFFEILLPLVACLFVFGSIPKQMKNFLATGLLFLAIGIVRLEQDLFKEHAAWPLSLLLTGLLLMFAAAHYSPLRMALTRLVRRKP